MKAIELFGCRVDLLSMDETLGQIQSIIKRRTPVQHCVLNAAKVNLIQKDGELKKIVNQCGLVELDGMPLVWLAKWKTKQPVERIAGIDLMKDILAMAEKEGYRIYFLGAKSEILNKMLESIRCQFPKLTIAGSRHGYFSINEEQGIVAEVAAARADILFIGISSPYKEKFLARHLTDLNVPFCMGVGGSFDIFAGLVQRAPKWMQSIGMEWLYRFLQEPGRLWRRYLIQNLLFLRYLLHELGSSTPSNSNANTL